MLAFFDMMYVVQVIFCGILEMNLCVSYIEPSKMNITDIIYCNIILLNKLSGCNSST